MIETRPQVTHSFDPDNRTYYVSDERLRAFRQLTTEQKLRWVEELSTFLGWRNSAGKSRRRTQRKCRPDAGRNPGGIPKAVTDFIAFHPGCARVNSTRMTRRRVPV